MEYPNHSLGDNFTLRDLQREHDAWEAANFPPEVSTVLHSYIGVTEEVGELGHAILKMAQGIRGSEEEHRMAAYDACGDILVYLVGVAGKLGFSLQDALEYAWAQVRNRDWKANPLDGGQDGT